MNGIVVHRAVDGLACAQRLQILHHEVGIEGVRVVVVELAALLIGHIGMGLIIVVVVDHADVFPKVVLEMLGQGGLARAGPAGDADDHGVHASRLLVFPNYKGYRRL